MFHMFNYHNGTLLYCSLSHQLEPDARSSQVHFSSSHFDHTLDRLFLSTSARPSDWSRFVHCNQTQNFHWNLHPRSLTGTGKQKERTDTRTSKGRCGTTRNVWNDLEPPRNLHRKKYRSPNHSEKWSMNSDDMYQSIKILCRLARWHEDLRR